MRLNEARALASAKATYTQFYSPDHERSGVVPEERVRRTIIDRIGTHIPLIFDQPDPDNPGHGTVRAINPLEWQKSGGNLRDCFDATLDPDSGVVAVSLTEAGEAWCQDHPDAVTTIDYPLTTSNLYRGKPYVRTESSFTAADVLRVEQLAARTGLAFHGQPN